MQVAVAEALFGLDGPLADRGDAIGHRPLLPAHPGVEALAVEEHDRVARHGGGRGRCRPRIDDPRPRPLDRHPPFTAGMLLTPQLQVSRTDRLRDRPRVGLCFAHR